MVSEASLYAGAKTEGHAVDGFAMTAPISLAVLLSGGGTTLENILTHIREHDLPARVDLVVSSREDAYGLTRAKNHGIETAIVPSSDYRSKDSSGRMRTDWRAMSVALNECLLPRSPDLVCFAGFMCMYILPEQLTGKVMNIHPALIPAFCGKGMYGHHVHEAVVASGVKVTGCTVHFVNNEYDAGPIILQRTCPVLHTDSADDVAARVFEEECLAYPQAIRLFAENRLRITRSVVHVLPKESE